MADVTKVGTPSLATLNPPTNCYEAGLVAGEAIGACDACYIKAADGKVWKSTGAAATAPAKVRGFAAIAASTNDPVTLMHDVDFEYGSALSPGADLFLSGTTAGGLVDAASTGGTAPIGYVVNATMIHVYESRY